MIAVATKIEPTRKVTTAWYVDDTRIVSENVNGTFDVCDWHNLDEDGLRRVHATIGAVLTDIAAKRQGQERITAA